MSTRTIERHRRSGGTVTYPMHHVLGIIPNPSDFPRRLRRGRDLPA